MKPRRSIVVLWADICNLHNTILFCASQIFVILPTSANCHLIIVW